MMSDEKIQENAETENVPTAETQTHVEERGSVVPVASESGAPTAAEAAAPENASTAQAPVVAEATPVADPAQDDKDAFEREMRALDGHAQHDDSLRRLHEGDVITGTVMQVDKEGVLVDVGAKSEGIIRLNELSREQNINPADIVKVGDTIKVFVLEPENSEGNPILSKKRADFEQAWDKVAGYRDSGEVIHALVTDRVKGGLVVDLGIRGFVPASHVGTGSLKNNLDRYIGQSIALKVIEVDKERRKVVLSNKLAQQEERAAKMAETRASLGVGQVRHGIVRRLTAYGAFVDLGGIDGLLHISEMSWSRINDPKEVLKEGQEVDVQILKMDLESNRVSLGMRQILPDPWEQIGARYNEGDVISGLVSRIVPFGAFVSVEGDVEGVIPNAEFPRHKGGRTAQPITVNETVEVKIIGLRPDERKMTLSMRALQPVEEREAAPAERSERPDRPDRPERAGGRSGGGGRDRGEREDYTRFAPGRQDEGRFTIGDALAAQKRERTRRDRRNELPEEYDELADIEVDTELVPEPGTGADDETTA